MASACTSEEPALASASPAIVLRASGVDFTRSGSPAPTLVDLDLELRAGECALVQGATGCGKSTLLRALAGLSGVECSRGGLQRSERVVLLLQHVETQLLCTTVGEEVALGLRSRSLSSDRIRERVRVALGRVGLSGSEQREVDRLSAGQKQRVVLAALLALDPKVLLLDEPNSALDPEARLALARVLGDLKHRGTALLIADHAPAALMDVVDRTLAIEAGRLRETVGAIATRHPSLRLPAPVSGTRARRTLITGPNGSGKSTRLRALAARDAHTGRVALVIQEPRRSLFARSVWDEAEFGLLRRGVVESKRRARVSELLTRFDLFACRDRSPRRLSFGQQHRLAIAAALAPDPALILLDEPFAGLDPAGRNALLALLEDEQARSGAELVVASHDREPLAGWCDRIVELSSDETSNA